MEYDDLLSKFYFVLFRHHQLNCFDGFFLFNFQLLKFPETTFPFLLLSVVTTIPL